MVRFGCGIPTNLIPSRIHHPQLPERHGLGRHRSFHDLARLQRGREQIGGNLAGVVAGLRDRGLGEPPHPAVLEHGVLGVDAFDEMAVVVVDVGGDARQLVVVVAAGGRPQDRFTVDPGLAHPDLGLGFGAAVLTEDHGFDRIGALLHQSRHRVERHHRRDADDERDQDRRRQELPDETPEARATRSSSLRVRLRNTAMEPNSTQNGSTCSDTDGVRRNERKATFIVVTPAMLPVRRSSSTKSITKTRLKIVANTARIIRKKRTRDSGRGSSRSWPGLTASAATGPWRSGG
ncbi:hypothetical protein MRB53_031084 [Persea americana]|uniref:Uncharacterized protein n=1 Tax=Persea americana TaxID=3435 RepID=A0ACC2KNG0_PERAE|nr:hypothetical protein MRB53_031084 [Persea americana]